MAGGPQPSSQFWGGRVKPPLQASLPHSFTSSTWLGVWCWAGGVSFSLAAALQSVGGVVVLQLGSRGSDPAPLEQTAESKSSWGCWELVYGTEVP